jgi:hypothetical protein
VSNRVPNLDAMPADDLMRFWLVHQRGNRKRARELFPDTPALYTRVAANLANYASNKATAMQCRLRGDVQAATIYERICDDIYGRLPEWARW